MAVADDLGLTVTLLGTPAEEGGGGKVVMLERGAFEGVHLALMAHPGPVDVARARPYAVSHLDIAYDGKAAHAAAYPEDGVNAADAFNAAPNRAREAASPREVLVTSASQSAMSRCPPPDHTLR